MSSEAYGVLIVATLQIIFFFKWLTGLESRIGVHERTCDERMKRLDERHVAILRRLDDISVSVGARRRGPSEP